MSRDYRQAMQKICIDYNQVHGYTRCLYEQLQEVTHEGVILIALARGGWITSRILAASYEEDNKKNYSYSIDATYINRGHAEEYVAITQALDKISKEAISELIPKNLPIVIVDSVCQTGREILAVKNYLRGIFPNAKIYIAVMSLVHYKQSSRTPWRSVALQPDFYGHLISNDQMPYVEFPWEYSSLGEFHGIKESK